MPGNKIISEWKLQGMTLNLIDRGGSVRLAQQTGDWDLLTCLVKAGFKEATRCALDIIFQYGFTIDTVDALRAYSAVPLADPPQQYLDVCYAVDWSRDHQTQQLFAIVLAGSSKQSDKDLLCKALRCSKADMRDGALYAASSFNDMPIIEAVIAIAASNPPASLNGTGEPSAIALCFQRWVERETLTAEDLSFWLRRSDTSPNYRCTKEWMNFTVCPAWRELPYLDAALRDSGV